MVLTRSMTASTTPSRVSTRVSVSARVPVSTRVPVSVSASREPYELRPRSKPLATAAVRVTLHQSPYNLRPRISMA